jgi:hypothetical protein
MPPWRFDASAWASPFNYRAIHHRKNMSNDLLQNHEKQRRSPDKRNAVRKWLRCGVVGVALDDALLVQAALLSKSVLYTRSLSDLEASGCQSGESYMSWRRFLLSAIQSRQIPMFMPSYQKMKKLLTIRTLVTPIAAMFFVTPALANEAHIINYKNGFNYLKKSEAGPINLITSFYEDNYRQFYSHAIRFYYKSTDDNTLHEIKAFTNTETGVNVNSKIAIHNTSGPDCEFSMTRLVRKGDDLILVFFKREFNTDLSQAEPAALDISLFRLTKEESPLDSSRYYFKKYKNSTSEKSMCTLIEIDNYLRSNLSKLLN